MIEFWLHVLGQYPVTLSTLYHLKIKPLVTFERYMIQKKPGQIHLRPTYGPTVKTFNFLYLVGLLLSYCLL